MNCILLGCGHIAQYMLERLVEKPWFAAGALVDVNPGAAARAAQILGQNPAVQFRNLSEALEATQAEMVIINTPAEYHAEQVRTALQAGRHVLVAKPFAETYQTAADLILLADERGLDVAVAEQMRYMRHYRAVIKFLDSGELGRVEMAFFLNSKPRHQALNLKEMKQPAVLEMSSHHFDLLMALFPERVPEWIMLDGFSPSWSVFAGTCMLNGSIRFSPDLHLLYHAGYSSQSNCYELRLEGTRGVLRCRGAHMSAMEMRYEYAPRGGEFQPLDIEREVVDEDAWSIFFDTWYAGRTNQTGIPFSGRNNLKVMALMDAAIHSIESRQPCQVANNPRYRAEFCGGLAWRAAP